jgi:hypothetical protein
MTSDQSNRLALANSIADTLPNLNTICSSKQDLRKKQKPSKTRSPNNALNRKWNKSRQA